MKLAKLILPKSGLLHQHQALQHRLLTNFGAYVAYEGTSNEQSVMIYEVAMELSGVTLFRQIAQRVARDAGLENVMIVTPCGDVEFVHPLLTAALASA